MPKFEMRALEVHSNLVWNFDHLRNMLEVIKRRDLTALVLHRNDIVDLVVYPGVFFGADPGRRNIFERYRDIYPKLYKYTPTRRSGPYQRRDYLKRVFELAERQGVDIYFENKELYFPDVLLELYPELTQNGTVCPNQPFWWDFLKVKYTELYQEFPSLKGVITAPGTGESRVAISSNRCTCDLCKATTPGAWYEKLLNSMHEPIKAAGGALVVRDFVFDRQAQSELADAIERLPKDIIVSLKNTPHDFYPTFPDNPRIGDVGDHPQWVEYDTMGQYFGWGVAPAIIIDDYRRRMEFAERKGAVGIILRTDWESLDGHTVFHNANLVNLHAASAIARENDQPDTAFYREWMTEKHMISPDAAATAVSEAASWADQIFSPSWDIVAGSLFINDCVFSDSSNYPVSLDHAWWLAETKNSLKDWDPSKSNALATDERNVQALLAEKDNAVAQLEAVMPIVRDKPNALTEEAHRRLVADFTAFLLYVRGWRAIGRACVFTKQAIDSGSVATGDADRAIAELVTLAREIRDHEQNSDLHFVAYVAMGWERLLVLHDDLSQRLHPITQAA